MHIAALVLIVALAWVALAALRKSCGHAGAVRGPEAWLIEQHARVVQLGTKADMPADHPVARVMKNLVVAGLSLGLVLSAIGHPAAAADDAKVKAATRRVERGGKMIGDGKVGAGLEETAKGVGDTVVEGAKFSGNKLKASGKAAEPAAKSAWGNFKKSASSFGTSVKRFFTRLFS
jgi:hypothetical protein